MRYAEPCLHGFAICHFLIIICGSALPRYIKYRKLTVSDSFGTKIGGTPAHFLFS